MAATAVGGANRGCIVQHFGVRDRLCKIIVDAGIGGVSAAESGNLEGAEAAPTAAPAQGCGRECGATSKLGDEEMELWSGMMRSESQRLQSSHRYRYLSSVCVRSVGVLGI